MNRNAYDAVRSTADGAGVMLLERAWLRLTGRDRQSYLNGQVSNDVLSLQPGRSIPACLLNNTGHLLADLTIHATADDLWIELDPACTEVAAKTLNRFLIREKVKIENLSAEYATITIQGQGANGILASALAGDSPAMVVQHQRTTSPDGFDLILPTAESQNVLNTLLRSNGAAPLDPETLEILRAEAGIPKWGAELDETIIPLEANLLSSISRTKGCYMGQEIIARILSRGHTNRTLTGFKLNGAVPAGTHLFADSADIGRLTSVVDSPELGLIALGYIRNEHAAPGTTVSVGDAEASVAALPFVT